MRSAILFLSSSPSLITSHPSTFQPHQAAPIVAICPRDRSADSPFAMTSEAPIKKKARVHIPDIHEGDGSGHASFMPPAGPSSLQELMSYPFIFLRIVLGSIHCGLFHHNMMIGQRLKTQYSGIGAWEWSRLLIDKAAAQMMIEHAPCSIQESCDIGEMQQRILRAQAQLDDNHCVFPSLLDRIDPDVRTLIDAVSWPSTEEVTQDKFGLVRANALTQQILSSKQKSYAKSTSWCFNHSRTCPVTKPAGHPWSPLINAASNCFVDRCVHKYAGRCTSKVQLAAGYASKVQSCWMHQRSIGRQEESVNLVEEAQ